MTGFTNYRIPDAGRHELLNLQCSLMCADREGCHGGHVSHRCLQNYGKCLEALPERHFSTHSKKKKRNDRAGGSPNKRTEDSS